jgi:hypothetical protein
MCDALLALYTKLSPYIWALFPGCRPDGVRMSSGAGLWKFADSSRTKRRSVSWLRPLGTHASPNVRSSVIGPPKGRRSCGPCQYQNLGAGVLGMLQTLNIAHERTLTSRHADIPGLGTDGAFVYLASASALDHCSARDCRFYTVHTHCSSFQGSRAGCLSIRVRGALRGGFVPGWSDLRS